MTKREQAIKTVWHAIGPSAEGNFFRAAEIARAQILELPFGTFSDEVEDDGGRKLALFLDAISASLANDLAWALKQLDDLRASIVPSVEGARRYVEAECHLRTRRAYEAACQRELRTGAGSLY